MAEIQTRSRELLKNPHFASAFVNGWRFRFSGYERTNAKIAGGGCHFLFSPESGISLSSDTSRGVHRIPVDKYGAFLRIDGKPLVVNGTPVDTINGKDQNKPGINFWEVALGYDGSIINNRSIGNDTAGFFSELLLQTKNDLEYTGALRTVTDKRGVVTFNNNGKRVVLPTGIRSGEVILIPQRILDDPIIAVFDAANRFVGECGIDRENILFFTESKGLRSYYLPLERLGGIFHARLPDYDFRFGGSLRSEDETAIVRLRDGKLHDIQLLKAGRNPLAWKLAEKNQDMSIISVGGENIPKHKRKEAGETPTVTIRSDTAGGKTRYYVCFGSKSLCRIKKEAIEGNSLKPGDVLEVESIGDKVTALIHRGKSSTIRIPFIMNWRWDGEKFGIDCTTSSDMTNERMQGIRLIEQARSNRDNCCDYLTIGTVNEAVTLRTPWDTELFPLSIVAHEGAILLLSDSPRLSKEEWQLAELIARAKSGSAQIQRDEAGSKAIVEEAKAVGLTAEANLLNSNDLEQAYSLYIKAYTSDPLNFDALKKAVDIRKLAITRRKYHERRKYYFEWLAKSFSKTQTAEQQIKLLNDFLGQPDQNPSSAAYVFELVAGLAEGKYGKDKELFAKVFELIPSLLDQDRATGKRILLGLRVLFNDPNLSYIAKWILCHPPTGFEAIFKRRREQKFGIEPGIATATDETKPIERNYLPVSTDKQVISRDQVWKVVLENMGLIKSIAKRYIRRGLSFEDLVHEGLFGCYRAVELFDPALEWKFSTYATWWIEAKIQRAIENQGRTIRITSWGHELISKVRKAEKALTDTFSRKPTEAEIAAYLDITPEKLMEIRASAKGTTSLESPIGDGDATTGDFIENDASPNPEDEAIAFYLKEHLRGRLRDILDEREYFVISMRFGLDGNTSHSLEEIGDMLHVSRERARQIEAKALGRLRKKIPEFAEFLH